MTKLKRRALIGDREAQRQCTEKGIVLPCPRCGKAGASTKYVMGDFWYECPNCHSASGFHSSASVALYDWNTRPAPPVGSCKECQHLDEGGKYPVCLHTGLRIRSKNDFCSRFEPKGEEEDADD